MKKFISLRKNKIPLIILIILVVVSALVYICLSKVNINSDLPVEAENSVTDENQELGDFVIKIAKIGIEAPILMGVDPTSKNEYNQKLKNGVALMTGSALPGSGKGNIFIYGHSSAIEASKYQKVFSDLNELVLGDKVLVKYNRVEYNYIVQGKKIVEKDDLSVLNQTDIETLSIMTCWPIGTDKQRLMISAIRE